MQAELQDNRQTTNSAPQTSPGNGIVWGITGGLAATFVMDLILVGAFTAAGMAPFTCFSLVGDTVVRLFLSHDIVNSAWVGVAAHYLIGPLLGGIFGIAARSVPALQAGSRKKAILYAVIYAEIASQPILALTPILLRLTLPVTLLWYGGSMIMHLVWGSALGVVWNTGRYSSFSDRIRLSVKHL
jgi:hypothetical protein